MDMQAVDAQAVTKRFAVIGHPVSHSLSPRIHAAFGARPASRSTMSRSTATDFDAALHAFRAGGNGANITLPYKQRARGGVQRRSATARGAPARSTR